MIKKLLFISALVIYFSELFSQQAFGELNANNIRCSVTSTGDLFNRFGQDEIAGFEVPAGSDLRTIYAANLWVGGLSPDQQLKLAAETYQANGQDWFPGPLTNDGNATITDEIEAAYDHVWMANSTDVYQHLLYFQTLEEGGQEAVDDLFPDGYVIPSWFFEWPAHGDVALGLDYFLAPFMDVNGNGLYDPHNGDYPFFCGDECLFFIFNDKGNVHTESQGQSIGLEVHGMLYSFNSGEDDMLNNTVFLKYKIINQGMQTLTNAYIGLWADFDLGTSTDDYTGTNVFRSAQYVYNGDPLDETSAGSNGYQENPPMQAIALLGGPYLDGDDLDNPLPDDNYSAETQSYGEAGIGFGDGIIDNERFGLRYSLAYSGGSNPVSGDPSTAVHYYNYMRGLWKNGQIWRYGGDGMNSEGVEDFNTRYFYPSENDPLLASSDGIEAPLWNEAAAENLPGDRQMLGSAGPFTLEPGDIHYIDLAFVFLEAGTGGMSNEQLLDERLKSVKLFFNNELEQCQSEPLFLGQQELDPKLITFYPNPMYDIFSISTPHSWNNITLEIVDIAGNLVTSKTISGGIQQINIEDLSAGTYALKLQYGEQLLTQKIIVQ